MDAHIINAGWRDAPSLLVRVNGQEEEWPLSGKFSWNIGKATMCVGRDGPCPTEAPTSQWSQCRQCDDLESPECIFEPKCKLDPTKCSCPFGIVPHIVYIALYGKYPKVGMTQERRVRTRLTEQGADGYFVLKRLPNRAEARMFEQKISFMTSIPEFRSHKVTLPLVHKPQDWGRIELAAEELRAQFAEHSPEVFQQIPCSIQPIPAPADRVRTSGHHEGTWIGAKGKYLFYEAKKQGGMLDVGVPKVVAISRGSLEGRFISVE